MNDFLKKLLEEAKQADRYLPNFNKKYEVSDAPLEPMSKSLMRDSGVPVQEDFQPLEQNDPYLDPAVYPSPLMTPMEATQRNVNLRPQGMTFEPEQVKGEVAKPAKLDPGPPPTGNEEAMDKIELPQEAPSQKSTLESLLASMKPEQDNELGALQKDNQDYIRNILLARAGHKLGASIADVKADNKFGQDFIDLSNQEVSDLQDKRKSEKDIENQKVGRVKNELDIKRAAFELGDKEKENDPNSEVSQAFRTYAKSYVEGTGIKIDDRLSMADLQKQMGIIGQKVQMKLAADLKRENMNLAKEGKQEQLDFKKKEKGLLYGDKIAKQLEPIMDRKDKAERIKKSVAAAMKDPSGFRDIQAIYDFVKNMDPDSAVREGEISLAQSTLPAWKKLELQVDGQLNGDVKSLTPKLRAELAKIADEVVQGIDVTLNSKINRQRMVASELGIEEKYWNRMYKSPELKAAEDKAPQGASVSSGKITVSNGVDTFEIDEADLAEAKKDGFEKVK